jgi:signal transduction histidine kinase
MSNNLAGGADNTHRVLVLASIGRDGELLTSFLRRRGAVCRTVANMDDLVSEIHHGAATAVITEESLDGSSETWIQRMQTQPVWSDFPLIILTGLGVAGSSSTKLAALQRMGNITLLERPVRTESLLSAIHAAVKARERQYEIRDYMQRQADSQEALRRTEKLAVAGRLAASIAHEINNPLAAITNLLYLVSTSQNMEDVKTYSSMAQEELKRVSEIANQTLRFYRAGGQPESITVSDLIDSAVALFTAKLRGNGITVERRYQENCSLVCPVGEIRQVMVNLIANAIEAMRDGGSLLLCASARPHPYDSTPGVRITVVDHGEGIAPEVRKRLFEPFFTTKGSTGTGLGLWLTKDIIERNQGFIRVRNHRSPHGAIFSFWLPQEPGLRVQEPMKRAA